jgi:predicted RNase H-like nuclease (RuvC/YqgF family)
MSKRKSELEDKIEQLESELEELKTTNNALRRRLRKIDSKFNEDDYLEDDQIEKKYERLKQYTCPYCKKLTMEEVEIAGRFFKRCDNCGKRTKAEKTQ